MLAYLAHGLTLPWNWEPRERVANIKRQMFIDECGVLSDDCEAELGLEQCCSTAHCRETVEGWLELETLTETDEPLADALQELWSEVLAAQDDGEEVDYKSCLRALGAQRDGSEPLEDDPRPCRVDSEGECQVDEQSCEEAASPEASIRPTVEPIAPGTPMPPLFTLTDPALAEAHTFSRTANWLIPGRVMCGHYPGGHPTRPMDAAMQAERLISIRNR